ncbi:MAG: Peptide methionine sulfoxide reductase MsrA [candidate division WS6 bacterium GW2011_GWF2_39_15]|uniref:Peptide methionine sulfoxide reductase MsrA n=1 Tax=candidate division WS6 bacterium GW2011_GWF2_39_15 TaxID=1619100 RepID=A0A0G0Q5U1_9BACT|nr:MAG: Peptide methionine sulfoxide reductase MsrA [candidate division WS6 bacterium GW2011_GWF2_39_15]
MMLNRLTDEEKEVILNKSTERPFTGEYDDFYKDGIYICRQCNLPLFEAKAKYDAGCGWPSFDDTYTGSVKELVDRDGSRTEILCSRCGGHLGHVFRGEKFSKRDTRHCVNSLSIKFVPRNEAGKYMHKTEKLETIILGGGCFWCVEAVFNRVPGVVKITSGYAGGVTKNPSYEEVSAGETGHAEVVKIEFEKDIVTLGKILEVFFLAHDPTTLNRQGNDVGTQYRSIVLYTNKEQVDTIKKVIERVGRNYKDPIVTEVKGLKKFYEAEDYHKQFYEKNSSNSYCRFVIKPKLDNITKEN